MNSASGLRGINFVFPDWPLRKDRFCLSPFQCTVRHQQLVELLDTESYPLFIDVNTIESKLIKYGILFMHFFLTFFLFLLSQFSLLTASSSSEIRLKHQAQTRCRDARWIISTEKGCTVYLYIRLFCTYEFLSFLHVKPVKFVYCRETVNW